MIGDGLKIHAPTLAEPFKSGLIPKHKAAVYPFNDALFEQYHDALLNLLLGRRLHLGGRLIRRPRFGERALAENGKNSDEQS